MLMYAISGHCVSTCPYRTVYSGTTGGSHYCLANKVPAARWLGGGASLTN
nr:MAG TPA: 4Fe-4S double cluster binding domain protein [Caudoviricetes sp.]